MKKEIIKTVLNINPSQNTVVVMNDRGVLSDTIKFMLNGELQTTQNRKENWAMFIKMVKDPTIEVLYELWEDGEIVESMPFDKSLPYLSRTPDGKIIRSMF